MPTEISGVTDQNQDSEKPIGNVWATARETCVVVIKPGFETNWGRGVQTVESNIDRGRRQLKEVEEKYG